MKNTIYLRSYLIFAVSVELLSIILQLFIAFAAPDAGIATILRLTTFFTIDTNLVVLFTYTVLLLFNDSKLGRFFKNENTLTAVLTYITFVSLAYHILLLKVWNPTGLQWYVGELLHWVNPLIFLIFWSIFVNKRNVQFKNFIFWMGYPFLYFVWVMLLGHLNFKYPYFFLDINKEGYLKVFLTGTFLLFSMALIAVFYIFSAKTIVYLKNGQKTDTKKNYPY